MSNTTYFRINTDLVSYKKTQNYKMIKSPFHYWLRDGYAYLTPTDATDNQYKNKLRNLKFGSIIFAHENGSGFVAAGTVMEAWDEKTYDEKTDLYPNAEDKIYKIRVNWNTRIHCSAKELRTAGMIWFRGTVSEIYSPSITSYLTSLINRAKAQDMAAVELQVKSIENNEGDCISENEEVNEIKSIFNNNTLSKTEKMALVKVRLNQGLFRSRLQLIEPKCRLTGISNPDLLRASHILPWSISTPHERLDGNNGLFLSPHVDHLFDKYLITFTDTGDLLASSLLTKDMLEAWGLKYPANVGTFNSEQAKYLKSHRDEFFKTNTILTI